MRDFIKDVLIAALIIFCIIFASLFIESCAKPGPSEVNGTTGQPGVSIAGPQGIPGTPGTALTFVQFCPGFTQNYPSTFAESGFCVNGQMWAIYSANGGFLAELPPGTYSSNGINASCTFTLEANCVVVP